MQSPRHQFTHLVVTDVSCGRHHQAIRGISGLVVSHYGLQSVGFYRFNRAANGTPQRMRRKNPAGKFVKSLFAGVIQRHRQLVEDNAAFHLKIGGIEQGRTQHIHQNINGHGHVLAQNFGIVVGAFPAGSGVGIASDRVKFHRYLMGGAPRGSFK